MIDLSTKYAGLELQSPIIASSSGLTDSIDSIKKIEKYGGGAVVVKSIFEEEILMEADKAIAEKMNNHYLKETFDYIDSHLKGMRIDEYIRLISGAKKAVRIPIIASINCTSKYEWPYFVHRIQEAGADALELNMFLLPSDEDKSSADNENQYFEIIESVRNVSKIPLTLKISFYFSSLAQMIKRLSETEISAIVLFHRFNSPDFDLDSFKVMSTNVLSSPDEISISLRWISIMSGRIKCDLAASTGVNNGLAAIKQIAAGAKAVQVASALYKNGIPYIADMLDEMRTWMTQKGFEKLDDFRGKMSQKQSGNPAAYERIQFMKYFGGIQ